jgi:hypothetical protein
MENKKGKVLGQKTGEMEYIIKNVLYNNRLNSPKYLTSINKPQAVFKIIGTGIGSKRLNVLANYITRELDYQKEANLEPIQAFDGVGNEIGDMKEEVDRWTKDFDIRKTTKAQMFKQNKLEELEEKRDKLRFFAEKFELLEEEKEELNFLNKQIKGKYYINEKGERKSLKSYDKPDLYHLMFSVGGTGHNEMKMKNAMQKVINNQFVTRGLKTMFVYHGDTENNHFHLILSTKSDITNDRIYFDRQDIFAIKQNFVQELEYVGINRGAVARKDNPLILSKILRQKEYFNKSLSVYEKNLKKGNIDTIKFKQESLKKLEFLSSALRGDYALEKDFKNAISLKNKEILIEMEKKRNKLQAKQEMTFLQAEDLKSLNKQIKGKYYINEKGEKELLTENNKTLKEYSKELSSIKQNLLKRLIKQK